MAQKNCWEYMNCGEADRCPCVEMKGADGFLGGVNAGRACMFVTGTCCCGKEQWTEKEKIATCSNCAFYKKLKSEFGAWVDPDLYRMYLSKKIYIREFYNHRT